MGEDWNAFIETPPNFGQSFTPPMDVEFNSPLQFSALSTRNETQNNTNNNTNNNFYHDRNAKDGYNSNAFDGLASHPLSVIEKSNEKTGLRNTNDNDQITLEKGEIECRVIIIKNLPEDFNYNFDIGNESNTDDNNNNTNITTNNNNNISNNTNNDNYNNDINNNNTERNNETESNDLVRLFSPNAKNIINTVEKKPPSPNDDGTTTFVFEFFDLRNSLFYRNYLEGSSFDDRPLFVRYGFPRRKNEKNRPANNGTIVLFHLPPAVSNPQLSDIFGRYGEIRQIRGTPSKPKQRFIEYWDTRASAAALSEMNGKMIIGSKISIEFSVPGGMRRQNLE